MARELFKPFVVTRLMRTGAAPDEATAARMLADGAAEARECLAEILCERLVLLDRAPTMDRYGLQAFEPVLTDHRAIALHPLVCAAFNADLDGDQMAVHIPLLEAAQAEARTLMTSRQNLLASGSGLPRLAELERMGADIEPSVLVHELASIFREQGVRIHDKHFGVFARALHHPPIRGFISRTAFPPPGERQTEVLAKAAIRGETDPLTGRHAQARFGGIASGSPSEARARSADAR